MKNLVCLVAVLIIFLFLLLLWRMMEIAQNAPDDEGMFLVSALWAHWYSGVLLILPLSQILSPIQESVCHLSAMAVLLFILLTEMGIVFRVSSESKEAQ